MNQGENSSEEKKPNFFVNFFKSILGLIAWIIGFTVLIFVIRFPFYDDNLIEFITSAVKWSIVPIVLTCILMIGYWLFENLSLFRWMFLGLAALSIVLSVLKGCQEPFRCVETRYVTCLD